MKDSLVVFLTSILLLGSCFQESRQVELSIRVVNDDKSPIGNAHIFIDKTLEGRSNTQGYLSINREFPIDQRTIIEVRKESKSHYYAPYYESLVIKEGTKSLNINATLYSVPKPSATGNNTTTTAEMETKNEETNVEKVVDAITVKEKEEPKVSIDEAIIASPEPTEVVEEVRNDPEKPAPEDIQKEKNPQIASAEIKGKEEPNEPEILTEEKPPSEEIPQFMRFYVRSSNKSIQGAKIYYGAKQDGQFRDACTTNKSGQCRLSDDFQVSNSYTILVQKDGYQSHKQEYTFSQDGRIHIQLKKGHSADIFALTSHYGYRKGVEGVRVSIAGRFVGETDSFGHLSTALRGLKGDLVEVLMSSREYIPEEFATDYIIDGGVSLVKFYSPPSPEPIRVATLPSQVAGSLKGRTKAGLTSSLDGELKKSLLSNFFTSPALIAIDQLGDSNLDPSTTLLKKLSQGWLKDPIKGKVDAALLPTVVLHDPISLELKLIDSSGKVLAAARENLPKLDDTNKIDDTVKKLSQKILGRLPFEGSIISEEDNGLYKINLGFGEGRAIKVGDYLDVYGLQTDLKGQNKSHGKIAQATVESVREYSAIVRIGQLSPRAFVSVGDQVSYRGRKKQTSSKFNMQVVDRDKKTGVPQANIYFKGQWLGSTNNQGFLDNGHHIPGRGLLQVVKQGYEPFRKETKLAKAGLMELPLKRQNAYLIVESEPSGMQVYVEGKAIGQTPFQDSIEIPSGFVKLEIRGSKGYKTHSQILELDQGTLDLSGTQRIILEKDLKTEVERLVSNGSYEEAIAAINQIPKGHSDYYNAQHHAGVIYLTQLNQPAKAAAAFNLVTKNPEIAEFRDKRFIGSHINEGIALHQTATKLLEGGETDAAMAHLQKAIEVLEKVSPYLRFVKPEEHQQAYDNVHYYLALSHQELWTKTQMDQHLALAQDSWQKLLDAHDKKTIKSTLLKNAQVYLKQVEVALAKRSQRAL